MQSEDILSSGSSTWSEGRIHLPVAELLVSDLRAAVEYYVKGLGFDWIRENPDAVEVALGEMRITLKQAAQADFERSSVTLFCPDAVFLHDRLRTRAIRMKEQLTSKPFGFPNFCVLDVDGNELHFTSAPGGFTNQTANLERNNYPFDESKVRETAERSYEALQEYQILDSLMPAAFHALTEFAAMSFQSDRSMITLIDRKRHWFASHYGCSKSEMPLDCSVCVHVAALRMPIVIQDAKRDKKWRNHPAVRDDFRFYAGVPLFSKGRVGIGALSVVDKEPKRFTRAKLQKLNSLATIANCMIEKMRLYAKIEKCCSVALDN
jgi:GAF domain